MAYHEINGLKKKSAKDWHKQTNQQTKNRIPQIRAKGYNQNRLSEDNQMIINFYGYLLI